MTKCLYQTASEAEASDVNHVTLIRSKHETSLLETKHAFNFLLRKHWIFEFLTRWLTWSTRGDECETAQSQAFCED